MLEGKVYNWEIVDNRCICVWYFIIVVVMMCIILWNLGNVSV